MTATAITCRVHCPIRCRSHSRRSPPGRRGDPVSRSPSVNLVRGPTDSDWVELSDAPLTPEVLSAWAVRPECGAVVTFSGTARSVSSVPFPVIALEYETSAELALGRMRGLVALARSRWPDLGCVALHHRVGRVEVGQSAVVVAVSAPHRDSAFLAARFCIDSLKRSVPMWKRELWVGGSSWSEQCEELVDLENL